MYDGHRYGDRLTLRDGLRVAAIKADRYRRRRTRAGTAAGENRRVEISQCPQSDPRNLFWSLHGDPPSSFIPTGLFSPRAHVVNLRLVRDGLNGWRPKST